MLATRTPLATNERDVRGHARHAELVEVAERVDDVNQGLALPRYCLARKAWEAAAHLDDAVDCLDRP